ncbi:MAG: Nramp family divalent metal transporter [Candidatus Nanoarchaeia archaeon]
MDKMLQTIRKKFSRYIIFLSLIGPGLITALGDNDAGGIASNSAAGAHFGYSFLWILFVITIALTIILDMCVRMGIVTGKGLMDLIRENFGLKWSIFAISCLFIANFATIVSNLGGVAGGIEILGGSRYILLPIIVLFAWLLLLFGTYKIVEKSLLIISLVILSYIGSAFLAKPDWGLVLKQTFIPSIEFSSSYFMLIIAFVGTTIAPWMLFFIQSMTVDKGLTIKHLRFSRLEVWLSSFLTDYAISFFIIIACAATLFRAGIKIDDVADAALALRPLAGNFCFFLFSIGLLAASILATFLLPLTTAYAVCETFGFENGLNRKPQEAPIFYQIITFLLFTGMAIVLIPGIKIFPLIIFAQVVAGIITPILLIFILSLINDKELLGKYKNGPIFNAISWATVLSVIFITFLYLILIFTHKVI